MSPDRLTGRRAAQSRHTFVAMFRRATIVLLAAALSAASGPAWALPRPMSAKELLAASDLVALVRVLAVTCVAIVRDGHTGEKLPRYRAQLEVLAVKKGTVREGEAVAVVWTEIPKKVLGPWAVRYYPGEEVWTHLQHDRDTGDYRTTWWNAKGPQLRPADIHALPTIPGEVVSVPTMR
jgi:hypothetical protein